MGCRSCGGGSGVNNPSRFIYTAPDGSTQTFRTEIEAKAAVVRGGGSYVAQ